MVNIELLQDTLQHIEDNPNEWMQEFFFCGTAACFAGWTCLLSGYQRDPIYVSRVLTAHGSERAFTVAKNLLGLTEDQAQTLFSGGNSLESLRLIVKDLINGTPILSEKDYWELGRHHW